MSLQTFQIQQHISEQEKEEISTLKTEKKLRSNLHKSNSHTHGQWPSAAMCMVIVSYDSSPLTSLAPGIDGGQCHTLTEILSGTSPAVMGRLHHDAG
jgi:hypothetical protein